jgi:hypothetical protein
MFAIKFFKCLINAVLRSRDILVWIGFEESYLCLTDPDPSIFVSDLQDVNFFKNVDVYFLFTFGSDVYIIFQR